MFSEFRTFIARGNVVDLAVGVVIGAAFGGIVSSFTDDLLMPLIGLFTGGIDFSSQFVALGPVPASYTGSPTDYAALKAAGVPLFGYGKFLTVVLNFLIVAAALFFFIVKFLGWVMKLRQQEAVAPATPLTKQEELLTEIRDLLAKQVTRP